MSNRSRATHLHIASLQPTHAYHTKQYTKKEIAEENQKRAFMAKRLKVHCVYYNGTLTLNDTPINSVECGRSETQPRTRYAILRT